MKIQNSKTKVSPIARISLINFHFNKSGLSHLIDIKLGKMGRNGSC